MEYNASSIKILNNTLDDLRFDWKLSHDLSVEYNKPEKWIARSILACRESGKPVSYFINKYLKKIKTDLNESVNNAAKIIIKDDG